MKISAYVKTEVEMEARDLVGKVIFDLRKHIVGRVVKIHEPGEFISPVNKEPVRERVAELNTGDTLVASDEKVAQWGILDAQHENFFNDISNALGQLTKAMCEAAVALKIPPKLTFLMIGRAMQVQGGMLLKPEAGEGEGWDEG